MSGDWLDELSPEEREEWDKIVDHFRRDALGKLEGSAFVASLVPSDKFDVKFALETGAAVMLGKPILAVVTPGAEIPGKLALVADEIVEADLDTEQGREEITLAISRMVEGMSKKPLEEEVLAVWFTPEAIRQHFEMDSDNVARWVALAPNEELVNVGLLAMDSGVIWEAFHTALTEAVIKHSRELAEEDAGK